MHHATGTHRAPAAGTRLLRILLLVIAGGWVSGAGAFDHGTWDRLLRDCVFATADGASTAVDYRCFEGRREELDRYLGALSGVSREVFSGWPADEQLAFLINTYNAFTVELILGTYPDLESIRDLGSFLRSPWKKDFIALFGDTVSLDDIEHGMIREPGRFDEPRIHFAVNCASIGCPALRREAYVAARLEPQLEQQTVRFLADRSRNRFRDGELEVSSLFDWYGDDFTRGWRGADSLGEFLALYSEALGLTAAQRQALAAGSLRIDFLDYDWRLNAYRPAAGP